MDLCFAPYVKQWKKSSASLEGNAMDILIWIALGLVAGVLAKLIVPGKDPGGCAVTVLLGIAGALLAGYVGRVAGVYDAGEGAGWIAATLGAAAILVVYNVLRRR
jgi:uncharacterized membrane protein YeaQ/YmgE (transglycosylase-associated protein family)